MSPDLSNTLNSQKTYLYKAKSKNNGPVLLTIAVLNELGILAQLWGHGYTPALWGKKQQQ